MTSYSNLQFLIELTIASNSDFHQDWIHTHTSQSGPKTLSTTSAPHSESTARAESVVIVFPLESACALHFIQSLHSLRWRPIFISIFRTHAFPQASQVTIHNRARFIPVKSTGLAYVPFQHSLSTTCRSMQISVHTNQIWIQTYKSSRLEHSTCVLNTLHSQIRPKR